MVPQDEMSRGKHAWGMYENYYDLVSWLQGLQCEQVSKCLNPAMPCMLRVRVMALLSSLQQWP